MYSGQLRKPVIAVQSNGGAGRRRLSMGWCTCNKVWKDHSTNDYYYEITICSEYLYRSIKEICSTLLHEMVHLYCNEQGIKDTSRGHTYHNKRFQQIAYGHGLIVSYDERIGWSISQLAPDAEIFVEENADKSVFVVTREIHAASKPPETPVSGAEDTGQDDAPGEHENGAESATGGEQAEKPKQSMRKYVCPKCGCIIRATKEVNVLCGDCKVPFEIEKS